MNSLHCRQLPFVALAFLSANAMAEWRCDCTTIVDSCNASVSVQGDRVEVTSDHQQCARVDYFIDGMPFVALVVDGLEQQDWISRTQDAQILVQSCQVCQDNSSAEPQISRAEPAAASGELVPLIEIDAPYPPAAAANGLEGFAEVSYTVTPLGEVAQARVTSATPTGAFEATALSAIQRWRYPRDDERAAQTLSKRFDFTIADTVLGRGAQRQPAGATSVNNRRERNQCIREQVSYNYGEMIEVGLMNACSEPLLVYSCAQGIGRHQDQWVCVSSEQSQTLLVPPSDSRTGSAASVATNAGIRAFQYANDLFVTRAPNSEYWWLACSESDSACRDSGREWVRSIDRQIASLDPQNRTRRQLARSY